MVTMLVEILPNTHLLIVHRRHDGLDGYTIARTLVQYKEGKKGYSHLARLALLLPSTAKTWFEKYPIVFLNDRLWAVKPERINYHPDLKAWQNVTTQD